MEAGFLSLSEGSRTRLAGGHNERLGELAAELARIPVDVIVAGGTTAVILQK
jgi:hypothetical protein